MLCEIFSACEQVDKIEDSIDIIKSHPKPLAAYLFSNDKKLEKMFVKQISAGGMIVNDTVLHVGLVFSP